MDDCGLLGLIKGTYPISFICLVAAFFGAMLDYVPASKEISILERLLEVKPVKK